jgi:toxin ParE1/3/4
MVKPMPSKALKIRFASEALSDIDALLAYSLQKFGLSASQRYAHLLDLAVSDIRGQPQRLGVISYGLGSRAFFAYHLKYSNRKLSTTEKVGKPRHVIFFTVQGEVLLISRVLHDAMDFLQHLDLS